LSVRPAEAREVALANVNPWHTPFIITLCRQPKATFEELQGERDRMFAANPIRKSPATHFRIVWALRFAEINIASDPPVVATIISDGTAVSGTSIPSTSICNGTEPSSASTN